MKKILIYTGMLLVYYQQLFLIPPSFNHPYLTDVVIFSYDRPEQIDAAIRSVEKYITGTNKISAVCRTSSDTFKSAYKKLEKRYPHVAFVYQETIKDFKKKLMGVIQDTTARYITFMADDIIVKDDVNLIDCAYWIERTGAHGFFLRLGTHLTKCYPLDCPQAVPEFKTVSGEVKRWNFADGKFDWNYPNSTDMTIYPRSYIVSMFESLRFNNPNELEARWAVKEPQKTFGLFFTDSKIVNIPLNLVNDEIDNRNMNAFTKQELLQKFNEGKIIDIDPFYQIKNDGAHTAYTPTFIDFKELG